MDSPTAKTDSPIVETATPAPRRAWCAPQVIEATLTDQTAAAAATTADDIVSGS